jgi:aminopeptidase N
MKSIFLVLTVLFFSQNFSFSQTASDTIDIYYTNVFVNINDVNVDNVSAWTELSVVSKLNNVNSINFDFTSDLTVDSVKTGNLLTTFSHQNNRLKVNFISPLSVDDSVSIFVYYQGVFEQDPNGFGGNFFANGYAFNVGVSLSISPHSYGRAWHPCFDNFVEKSLYTITIECDTALTSVCTGLKVMDSTSFNKRYTKWVLSQPVSSYLAGFSVSDYETLEWNYISPTYLDTTPVIIGAKAIDTQNVKNSFINLNNAIEIYESKYGEYQWDRVGYVMTPFPYGAMEHATNIVYPVATVAGGTLNYETLMAHELSHHWWGDYITCKDSKEMWINEGSARFSEFVFLEGLYGQSAYYDEVYNNHYDVLKQHYIIDSGYYAIANVPENFTYGETTYNKGADVLYNLRGYLGDSLFFLGMRGVLDSAKWGNLSSTDYKNYMSHTVNVDLTDFFDGWVFQPGFPDFDIDSYSISGTAGNYLLEINIRQQLRGLNVYHQNVPLILTLVDDNDVEHDFNVVVSNQLTPISLNISFIPKTYFLNKNRVINYATTVVESTINNQSQSLTKANIYTFKTYNSSSLVDVRVENHWTGAYGNRPTNIVLSKDRYWNIEGDISSTDKVRFNLFFNGKLNSFNYDINLKDFVGASFVEDSLVLMYRPTPNDDWVIYSDAIFNSLGDNTDAYCRFEVENVSHSGQFAFGYKMYGAGVTEIGSKKSNIIVYPNPVKKELYISNIPNKNNQVFNFIIYNEYGKIVQKGTYNPLIKNTINIEKLEKGVYIIKLINKDSEFNQKFVKA